MPGWARSAAANCASASATWAQRPHCCGGTALPAAPLLAAAPLLLLLLLLLPPEAARASQLESARSTAAAARARASAFHRWLSSAGPGCATSSTVEARASRVLDEGLVVRTDGMMRGAAATAAAGGG